MPRTVGLYIPKHREYMLCGMVTQTTVACPEDRCHIHVKIREPVRIMEYCTAACNGSVRLFSHSNLTAWHLVLVSGG